MLKQIVSASLFVFLFSCSTLLSAEPVGAGYKTLAQSQPTHNPDKIEVIEFFWYGCPHCYSFEPMLGQWVNSLPKNVEFIRKPAVFNELWGKHAKAYYTAEALNVVGKVHADLFDAIQNKKQKLDTEDEVAKIFVAHDVDAVQFHDVYTSFLVDTKVRQAVETAGRYEVTGVPAMVVNGKYITSAAMAGSHEKMLEIINQLIAKEAAKK